jgi:hypothetical protein
LLYFLAILVLICDGQNFWLSILDFILKLRTESAKMRDGLHSCDLSKD